MNIPAKYALEYDRLRTELITAERRFRRVSSTLGRTSGSATNPAGDIGGIRSRSAKRKNQIFDAHLRACTEYGPAKARKEALEAAIADIESGERERRDDAREASRPAREEKIRNARREAVRRFDALKVGDEFDNGYGKSVITKKNRNSVQSGIGAVWTLKEITGIPHKEAEELRKI